jgi:hypothetical protein
MVMALPFLLGSIATALAMGGRRRASIWVWFVLALVLLAWLKHHASDLLDLSF